MLMSDFAAITDTYAQELQSLRKEAGGVAME